MTSSPLPIRRATGSADLLAVGGRDALASTPGGANMFGTTPGGTRIVYSREQLLSLASSPLSQTPPRGLGGASLPREISRSPEKASAHGIPGIGGSTPSMPGAFASSFGRSPAFNRSSLSGAGSSAGGVAAGGGVARSPPGGRIGNGTTAQPEARSPGNAFNFASGPVSPTTGRTMQSGIAAARPNAPAAATATSTTLKAGDEEPAPRRRSGEEQFDMEM